MRVSHFAGTRHEMPKSTTYARDIRMPVVKGNKVLDEGGQDGNLGLGIVVHDLGGQRGFVGFGTVETELFLDEALLRGNQSAIGDGGVVGGKGAVELEVVAVDCMVRIIENRVVIRSRGACLSLRCIREAVGVAVRAVVDGVLDPGRLLTSQEIVKGAVLHDEDDNILYSVFEVGGCCRAGCNPEQQAQNTFGLHVCKWGAKMKV